MDGPWWWSGDRWLPALSRDGRWCFDGSRWRRPHMLRIARSLLALGVPLLVAAVVLFFAVFFKGISALEPGQPTKAAWVAPASVTSVGALIAAPVAGPYRSADEACPWSASAPLLEHRTLNGHTQELLDRPTPP